MIASGYSTSFLLSQIISAAGRLYKGLYENIERRLKEHNAGHTQSTKPFVPWRLVYFETLENRPLAITREMYFKTAVGRKYLKARIKI